MGLSRAAWILVFLASRASAVPSGTIEAGAVSGEVEITPAAGGDPRTLQTGDRISEQDRIYTGFDSTAELRFSDGTVVVVRELTDMKVASYLPGEGASSARVWLRAGEIDARVRPHPGGKNDFRIRTPTTTCSVRGTNPVVTTALGATHVSFLTGHGAVTDETTGVSADTVASQQATNDPESGLQSDADLARRDSQGSAGVTGLTPAEQATGASLIPGETTVARGDVATVSGGVAASSQSFVTETVVAMASPDITTPAAAGPLFAIQRVNNASTSQGFGFLTRTFDFDTADLEGRPDLVKDVNVSVFFAKGDGAVQPEFHLLQMSLQAPGAFAQTLIAFNAFEPGTDPFKGTITFDQQATQGVIVDPTRPVEGTFQPQGSLDAFNGRPVTGQWLIVIGNDSTSSPVHFESATLEIVPEQGP